MRLKNWGMEGAFAGVVAILVASLVGCSGGGPSGSAAPPQQPQSSPTLQVLPTTFDFGRVTTSNTPAPLEVTIRNTGSAPLRVSSINLTATSSAAFTLSLTTGARPCGSAAPVVAAGETCTFRVAFQPSAGSGTVNSVVQIASNDAASPVSSVAITGTSEAVTALTVRINQVDTSCPNIAATAYVSVIDQGGFPVIGLTTGNFTLTQGSPLSANLLLGATQLDAASKPLAIAAVVDNSGSVTNQPVMYADMKSSLAGLFNNLRGNDVGELINFGSVYEVTVAYPSPSSTNNPTNKTALVAGLAVPWTGGANTLLYDSVYKAIDDTALQTAYRRAVIVSTDGNDDQGGTGVPASTHTLAEVISNAVSKKVPVFTIGIGDSVNASVLQDMAAQTGGVFYRAGTSQNLANIYQQLSSLLVQHQYALTFNQLPLGPNSPLRVDVVSQTGIRGDATSTFTSCSN